MQFMKKDIAERRKRKGETRKLQVQKKDLKEK